VGDPEEDKGSVAVMTGDTVGLAELEVSSADESRCGALEEEVSGVYLCISVSVDLCISVPVDLCISVSVDLCISVPVDLCISVSVDLCISVSVDLCISVSAGGTVEGVERPPLLSQYNQFRSGKGTAAVMPGDTGGMPELEGSSAGVSG